jgi:hypothetical protein
MGSWKAPITRAKCRGEPERGVTVGVQTQGGYKWPVMIYEKENSRQGKDVDGLRCKTCTMGLQNKRKQNKMSRSGQQKGKRGEERSEG